MAKLRINGDSSGYVDLEAPNAASSSTLDLDQVPQKNVANTFTTAQTIQNDNSFWAANIAESSHASVALRVTPTRAGYTKGISLGAIGKNGALSTGIQAYDTSDNSSNTLELNPHGGAVTTPSQPSFKAGLDTNTNVSSGNNIIFNSTSTYGKYNTGGHYSTTNGRFTAPVSGAYHFDVGLLFCPSVPNGTNFDDCAFLYLNGVLAAYDERRAEYVNGTTGNDGYYGTWIHTQLYMNSGDYVSVVNYNRFAGLHGNQRFTWFAGYLIG